MGIMFKKRSISVGGTDRAPVLSLPGLIVGNAHLANRHFIIFPLYERDTEQLATVRPCDFATVAPGALLVVLVPFNS